MIEKEGMYVKSEKFEFKEDLQRQIYSAAVRGMRTDEIAKFYELAESTVESYLKNARLERTTHAIEDDQEQKLFLIDQLDATISTSYSQLRKMQQKGSSERSQNTTGLINAIIRAIELKAKMEGYMSTTKLVGSDNGPILIADASERQRHIEELKQLMLQQGTLDQAGQKLGLLPIDNTNR